MDPAEQLRQLAASAPPEWGLEIPPRCFTAMAGEFVDYIPGDSLVTRFPFQERWRNPMGMMQGGLIVAAIDNTVGPLSYLVAPPSVTTHLQTTFIRPVTPDDAYIEVTASVVESTRHQLHLSAQVHNPAGKLLVTAVASAVFAEIR